jgi:hypothetical protein
MQLDNAYSTCRHAERHIPVIELLETRYIQSSTYGFLHGDNGLTTPQLGMPHAYLKYKPRNTSILQEPQARRDNNINLIIYLPRGGIFGIPEKTRLSRGSFSSNSRLNFRVYRVLLKCICIFCRGGAGEKCNYTFMSASVIYSRSLMKALLYLCSMILERGSKLINESTLRTIPCQMEKSTAITVVISNSMHIMIHMLIRFHYTLCSLCHVSPSFLYNLLSSFALSTV